MGVTSFYPSDKNITTVRKSIELIAERENIPLMQSNTSKIQEVIRPYFLEWCKRKNLNGNPYPRTNPAWLTEWAASGVIPPQNVPKKAKQTVADVTPQVDAKAIAEQIRQQRLKQQEVSV